MGKFTVNVFINSSQQDVFDLLSNAANFQPWLFEAIVEHILLVGLALGIIVQRNANNTAA